MGDRAMSDAPEAAATNDLKLWSVLNEIADERGNQDAKFGPVRGMSLTEWLCVLQEETGEAHEEYLDLMLGVLLNALGAATGRAAQAIHETESERTGAARHGRAAIRKELIQTAAVAVNIVEHLDRRDT